MRRSPITTRTFSALAKAFANYQQGDAALADYNRALELDPRLTVALNNRAGIRHDRGDLRGALNDYNRAIEIDPRLALLYGNRGVTRKALGDLKGAARGEPMFKQVTGAVVFTIAFFITINGQPLKNSTTDSKTDGKWEESIGGTDAAKAIARLGDLSPAAIRERLKQMRQLAYMPDPAFIKKVIELQRLPVRSGKDVEQLKAALQPVLDFHGRSQTPTYVLQSEQPNAHIVERAVLIITTKLLMRASEEEIRGIVAHELAHEYVWDQRILARKAKNEPLMREFELFCDAVAVFTMKELGDNPASYSRILERMELSNRVAGIVAGNTSRREAFTHPPLDARKKLIKFLCQQFD